MNHHGPHDLPPDDPDEWARWAEDFQRGESAPPPTPDPATLASRVASDTRRMALALASDVAGTAVVVAFWLWVLGRDARAELVAMAGASFVYVTAWLGYKAHAFRGQWRPTVGSVREQLAVSLQRRQSEVRWFGFAQASTAAFALVVAAWMPFMVRAHQARYSAEPWRGVVGFGVAFAILGGCAVYYGRRRAGASREVRALTALWREAALT